MIRMRGRPAGSRALRFVDILRGCVEELARRDLAGG
jgi:hypothetical protein